MATICGDCDRSFKHVKALQQHLRDSPAHAITFDCDDCDRAFDTEQALQQHLRDSPAHPTSSYSTAVINSFDMRPSLHKDVLRLLHPCNLSFDFYEVDDSAGVRREYDTCIMGKFTCTGVSCSKSWTSKQIAITIRQYPNQRYNARVYYQRCEACDSLSRPGIDESYAERISYRLAKWSGIALDEPAYSGRSERPHQTRLCEGCRYGRCWQSRL